MSLTPGARLGVYEIVGLIGAGGMGEVYRARDARLNREVAVKVVPPSFAGDADRLERFEQEARAAAALNHPNILSVFDVGIHEGAPYVVSELLEGETLRRRLAESSIQVRKAVEYAVQLAHGLAAAHEKGIVHRDLKPENIFLTADDRLKILDFGLAKLTQPDAGSREQDPAYALSAAPTTPRFVTQPGMLLGTMGYAAPEQLRGLHVDHRADIFSFGVILYEMLSGKRAFAGPTVIDTMTAILKDSPADLPLAERHIPPALARIVDRCLEKNPEARFQSTRDLGFALEGLSSHSEAGIAAVPTAAADRSVLSNPRVAWLATAACATGCAAVIVFAALGYFSPAAAVPPEVRLQVHLPEVVAGGFEGLGSGTFALSPDGRQLVFISRFAGRPHLWRRALNSDVTGVIAGTEGASLPFWSPDSRSIGFFSTGQLKRIDLADGLVRSLTSAPNPAGAAWGLDGTILFATSYSGPIYRIPAAGGEPVAVTRTAPPAHSGHVFPTFLPDGRRFLVYALGSGDGRGVYAGSLDSEDVRRIGHADAAAEFLPPDVLLLSRDDALIAQRIDLASLDPRGEPVTVARTVFTDSINAKAAVSASTAGSIAYRPDTPQRQLVWLDRAGRRIASAVDAQSLLVMVALSPDGLNAAVVRRFERNNDIWTTDLRQGGLRRLTEHRADETAPVWSPDGSQIVFGSDRKSGVFDLYIKRVDTADAAETLFLESATDKTPSDWSRDGKWILYHDASPKTGGDVWVKAAAGDQKPLAIAAGAALEGGARFSPDGRWIALSSNQSARFEVYVQPFPGPGKRVQVSSDGGAAPKWSSDGRELFYKSQTAFMSVPITVSAGVVTAATPVKLFDTPPGLGDIVPAPDGKRFLVNAPTDAPALITVLLNWAGGQSR